MTRRENFTLHQTLTLSELLLGTYYISARIKMLRGIVLFATVFGVLGAVLTVVMPAAKPTKWYIVIFDALGPGLFIFLFFFLFMSLGMILLTVVRPDNYRNLTYRFTPWGMEKSGRNIDVTRPWSKFLRLRESKNFLFLYISENDAHFIHKKAFESHAELEDFKHFAAQQIIDRAEGISRDA